MQEKKEKKKTNKQANKQTNKLTNKRKKKNKKNPIEINLRHYFINNVVVRKRPAF